jgi:hypothetical protein
MKMVAEMMKNQESLCNQEDREQLDFWRQWWNTKHGRQWSLMARKVERAGIAS